jgi:hypothetical protein
MIGSKALVVRSEVPAKRKRRTSWEIIKEMWQTLWWWGNASDGSATRMSIDEYGHTNVDGTRRSQRIANRQNLIEGN